jgi:hypothetical protein
MSRDFERAAFAHGNDRSDRGWCILWVRSQNTLALASSLIGAGFAAWTPTRIVKRDAPGKRRRLHMGQRPVMIEVGQAILPGFVFAPSERLDDLFRIMDAPFSPHPRFRVLQLADRIPIVSDASIASLREAEAEALAAITAVREEETRQAAREERANRLGSERARRKALRQERKTLERGTEVTVDEMPALEGMVGKVVEGRGTSATIHFGGALTMTVDAWRVRPVSVGTEAALTGTAA